MIGPIDIARIAQIAKSYQTPQVVPAQRASSAPLISEQEINLATLAGTVGSPAPYTLHLSGAELVCRRERSTPGGRALVSLDGRPATVIYPGARLKGPFQSVTAFHDRNSTHQGTLVLAALEEAGSLQEPAEVPAPAPVWLVGGLGTYVDLTAFSAMVGQPDPQQDTFFVVNGWRRLRVFAKAVMAAAAPFTGCDIVPWLAFDNSGGRLYENGAGVVTLGDTVPSGGLYRVFELQLTPLLPPAADAEQVLIQMVFQPRNVPANTTRLEFAVQGVE